MIRAIHLASRAAFERQNDVTTAILETMREPQNAASIVSRAYELIDKQGSNNIGPSEIWLVWKAMIDAIIEENRNERI